MKLLLKIYELLHSFSKEEHEFLDSPQKYMENPDSTSIGILECEKSLNYLAKVSKCLSSREINRGKDRLMAVWPYCSISGSNRNWGLKEYIRSYVLDYFHLKRSAKFYKKFNIKKILKNNSFFNLIYLYEALKVWQKLRKDGQLLDLEYRGIKIGDLIYSSYIRYSESREVNFNSLFLFFLVFQSIKYFDFIDRVAKRYKVSFYITGYTSYIEHGIPVRIFINRGVPVYSVADNRMIAKKHKLGDYSHKPRHWEYPSLIESQAKLGSIDALRREASKLFDDRFSGKIDPGIFYMKNSPYSSSASSKSFDGISGVVYLHDFLDSAYEYRHSLFNDLYSWAEFTLNFIEKNSLNIAIKPHPNQISEGEYIVNLLKEKYTKLVWIDPSVSNAQLISQTRCGVSVFGSILVELGYAGKVAIAAGDHPGSEFGLSYMPKTIDEYQDLLMRVDVLAPLVRSKEMAIDFYVAHNFLMNDDSINLQSQLSSDAI